MSGNSIRSFFDHYLKRKSIDSKDKDYEISRGYRNASIVSVFKVSSQVQVHH